MVLTVAVIVLSVALSLSVKRKGECEGGLWERKLQDSRNQEQSEGADGLEIISSQGKPENDNCGPCNASCPRGWIGFGSKCFYFSEDMRNWTSSQTSCKAQGAQLAQFDSLELLDYLKRYSGDFDYWIGLHRESPEHPWSWPDGTEYTRLIFIRGDGKYCYLSDRGMSSSRDYMPRKYICSKPNMCT